MILGKALSRDRYIRKTSNTLANRLIETEERKNRIAHLTVLAKAKLPLFPGKRPRF